MAETKIDEGIMERAARDREANRADREGAAKWIAEVMGLAPRTQTTSTTTTTETPAPKPDPEAEQRAAEIAEHKARAESSAEILRRIEALRRDMDLYQAGVRAGQQSMQ